MEKYANALAEVAVILDYLVEDDYKKIPKEIIEIVEKYKNEDYLFEYDEEIELKDQELLPETKAILYNFFRDYLATPEQREKIKKWQQEDRIKAEIKKQEEYEYKEIFNKKDINKTLEKNIPENNNQELIEYKESLFDRIKNWLKNLFK